MKKIFIFLWHFWNFSCGRNDKNSAHGLNSKIFVNFEVIFEIHDKNYPSKKIFMSLRQFWNFRTFWNPGKFCIFKSYFLVEFKDDGMRPNKSTKNARKGAHGLNSAKFLSIFRSFSKSTKKNSHRLFWNFRYSTCLVPYSCHHQSAKTNFDHFWRTIRAVKDFFVQDFLMWKRMVLGLRQ